MGKGTRKQKGAGIFSSKPLEPIHLDYTNRGLNNDEFKFIIAQYTPSEKNRIITLSIAGNNLTNLPDLPPNLQELYCYENKLISLPKLPITLNKLSCANNELTDLPNLPQNLQGLFCNHNKLVILPELPLTLEALFCHNNQLRVLPEIPHSIIPEPPRITTLFQCNNNPFIAPFDSFVDEYNVNNDVSVLINNVNSYHAEQKAKGINLSSMMQTLGRTELQGRIGLRNSNTPRNLNYKSKNKIWGLNERGKVRKVIVGTTKTINTLPMNTLGHIGSFMTGIEGSVNQQRNEIKRSIGKQRTRKQKGAGGFASKPEIIELDYSNQGLSTDDLGGLLSKYTPRERDRIATLIVSGNNLNELPAVPLQNLISLECDNNQLTLLSTSHYPDFLRSLTDLYPYLQRLYCSGNQLPSLPRLPPNIVIIECDNNLLTALPELPESLNFLICNNNRLTVLPELPPELQELECNGNNFIEPFNTFIEEYNNTRDISVLIDNVNRFYAQQRNNYDQQKRIGRNLMAMKETLGRRGFQENMGLGNANTPRNVNNIQMRNIGNNGKVRKVMVGEEKLFNKVPNGPQALVASFLTGRHG